MQTSDADYTAFLEKASADTTSNPPPVPPSAKPMTTQQTNAAPIPPALGALDAYYTSDTDARFEPVAIRRGAGGGGVDVDVKDQGGSGKLDVDSFRKMMHFEDEREVEAMSVEEWDPRGDYGEVVGRVREAAGQGAEVVVFRVGLGGVRCDYWVLGEGMGGMVVGFRVGAVES